MVCHLDYAFFPGPSVKGAVKNSDPTKKTVKSLSFPNMGLKNALDAWLTLWISSKFHGEKITKNRIKVRRCYSIGNQKNWLQPRLWILVTKNIGKRHLKNGVCLVHKIFFR